MFDKGRLEDGEGVEVDFRNTIILLTSNVGSEEIMRACGDGVERNGMERNGAERNGAERNGAERGEAARPEPEELLECIRPELAAHFKTAFLGRLVVVPYYPLGEEQIRGIVRLKLAKIARRFTESHRAELVIDNDLVEYIAARCNDTQTGARTIDNILTHTLLPELSARVLERMASESPFWSVRVRHAPQDEAPQDGAPYTARHTAQGGFEYLFTPPAPTFK